LTWAFTTEDSLELDEVAAGVEVFAGVVAADALAFAGAGVTTAGAVCAGRDAGVLA
jgi:hypothetical protein